MRIGIVCYPTFGGSGVIATELGKKMATMGHSVHFITSSQPVKLNLFSENIFFHEVTLNNYPLFKYQPYEVALTSKLVDVVKYEQLDVLHVHYAIPHASAAYMAKQILKEQGINIPIVTTLHGTDITLVGKDPAYEPVISFSINNSDAVTAVSESLKEDTYKHFNVANKEITVVNNFVCVDQYKGHQENCKKNIFAPNGEKILMHISNFRPVKRVKDVIQIFEKVRSKIPAKLLLIGDGPDRTMAEMMARDFGVDHDTHFLGKIKDTETALCAADLFLMTSATESFGLAALEAMAAKVPVVSTNSGGLPEVNVDGETGLLSEVGDVQKMADDAITILTDDVLYNKLSEGALKQAENHGIEKIIPQYINIYERVIAGS